MKIYAPNIHLFAFQLYKGANVDSNSVQADDIQLWQNADKIVRTTLHQDLHLGQCIDIHKEPENPRVDLLKDSEVKDDNYAKDVEGKISPDDKQQVVIKGFAHPLRLYDSYALWLNLRRPEKDDEITPTEDVDIAFLSKLNPNNCFTLEKNKLFLGQTLLITAWVKGAKDEKHLYQIAQECLEAVFPASQRPPLSRQGELFGSPIFEYGLFSQLTHYQHVLIWLFRDSKADDNFNLCYHQLLELFFFRTKIVKSYQDSRITYDKVASAYQEIEDAIDLPKKGEVTTSELKDLKNKLKELPKISLKYTRLLRNLEDYQNTIAINETNYLERLQQIRGIIKKSDLLLLETFSQQNSPLFQKQIQADLGYFRHGSTLLEQAISSIRGIVEIEQAERDRSLENTIQIVGVGLGAGAIVSGVVTQHIDKPFAPISLNNPPHPIVTSLFWSFAATLLFGSLAWLSTKFGSLAWLSTKLKKKLKK